MHPVLCIILHLRRFMLKVIQSAVKDRHRLSKVSIRVIQRRCTFGAEMSWEGVTGVLCGVEEDFDFVLTFCYGGCLAYK